MSRWDDFSLHAPLLSSSQPLSSLTWTITVNLEFIFLFPFLIPSTLHSIFNKANKVLKKKSQIMSILPSECSSNSPGYLQKSQNAVAQEILHLLVPANALMWTLVLSPWFTPLVFLEHSKLILRTLHFLLHLPRTFFPHFSCFPYSGRLFLHIPSYTFIYLNQWYAKC